MAIETPPKQQQPPAPDSPVVAHLKFKRDELVKKMERIGGLPETRDHDHDDALRRCRDGIGELDREIKSAGGK
jgi:hypothetical protein